jgi:hypothetical protein
VAITQKVSLSQAAIPKILFNDKWLILHLL